MHFEFLVEDRSGYEMIEYLIPKIIGTNSTNTFKIHPYKGCGSLPKGLKANQAADKRALFNQLPRLLKGYSLAFKNCLDDNAVIVVCDLDDKDKNTFISELNKKRDDVLALSGCSLNVFFCLAIEEGESWLLGDWDAPFPLIDISAYKEIGISVDTYNKKNGLEIPFKGSAHNPLYDSWAALVAYEHYME